MTPASATTPSLERRRERRVAVKLPMSVRGTDRAGEWFEEQTLQRKSLPRWRSFRHALRRGTRHENRDQHPSRALNG